MFDFDYSKERDYSDYEDFFGKFGLLEQDFGGEDERTVFSVKKVVPQE